MSIFAVSLQILACLGAGALVLCALGVLGDLPSRERLLWAFVAGLGVVGWLVFPLALMGLATPSALALLESALAIGCLLLKDDVRILMAAMAGIRPRGWGWLLAIVAAFVILFDLVEALAPPLDADSLAYHFDRARAIARSGQITFDPLAVDGVGALLIQMTYVPPLALGGEKGLTFWCMASGWASPIFLYAVSRRWLAPLWSMALALVLATTPAWVYGAGSGQVEPRLTLFALAGLMAVTEARARSDIRYAVLAGLMAGFYAAGKFFGLFFVISTGLVIILRREFLRPALVFSASALLAGFQWYLWNYIVAGDPVFPGLFAWLGTRDPSFWNASMDAFFRSTTIAAERPGGASWLLAYPFATSIGFGFPSWDAGRTGLGPYSLLILPFVLGGLWVFRAKRNTNLLSVVALGVLLFYFLWFLIGVSQRIRHLLPLWPAVLLCSMVVAERWSAANGHERLLAAAIATILGIQIAGAAIFALPYLRYVALNEDRPSFLERRLIGYAVVPWINTHLTANDRLLTLERPLNYYLERPFLFTMPSKRAVPDLRDQARDVRGQWADLQRLEITHILLLPGLSMPSPTSAVWRLGGALVSASCAEVSISMPVRLFLSRTLPSLTAPDMPADILKLRPDRCDSERLPRR